MYGLRACSIDEIDVIYRQKLLPLLEQQPSLAPKNPPSIETIIINTPPPPEAEPEEIPIVEGDEGER